MKLHGAFFTGATSVLFGAVASVFSVVNDALVQCSPPAQADTVTGVNITVAHPKGNFSFGSSVYFYPPRVDSISPSSGSASTAITITGAHFRSGATVALNGTPCTSVVVVNATTITCVTPASTAGAKTCRVTHTDGKFADKLNAFTYASTAPVLTSLDFDLADTAGGTSVTITGTNLGSATGCTVGTGAGSTATITANTSTSLTFTMPTKAAGSHNVQVTTAGGSSNTLPIEAWSPAQITGIDAYLDARKGVSVSGSNVTTWTEQTRSDALASTIGNQPVKVASVFGTQPSIRFPKESWVRSATPRLLASGCSVFWVGKDTSSDAVVNQGSGFGYPKTVLGDSNGGTASMAHGTSGGSVGLWQFAGINVYVTKGSGLNDGQARLLGVTSNSSTGDRKAYQGTTQQGTTDVVTYSTSFNYYNQVGNGFNQLDGYGGDLGAVIVVSGVISLFDQTKLYKWAKAEFGAL